MLRGKVIALRKEGRKEGKNKGKKGRKKENYRPISFMNIDGKTLERLRTQQYIKELYIMNYGMYSKINILIAT